MTRPGLQCAFVAVLALGPGLLIAQEPCPYETCALWIKSGFFTRDIIRGQAGEHVAKITVLAPKLALFPERSDSAHIHYASFRAAHSQGFWLTLVGGALAGTGVVARADANQEALALGLGLSGLGLTVGGLIRLAGAENHLARAVWWYNSTFPR